MIQTRWLCSLSMGLLLGLLAALAPSCSSNTGACGPSNCNGCCDGTGACVPGDTGVTCGAAGAACQRCLNGFCQAGTCFGSSGTDAGTCASTCGGCCDNTGACQSGSTVAACGADGGACQECSAGTTCAGGLCRSTTGCGGCIEDDGSCSCTGTPCIPLFGNRNAYCGAMGQACANCAATPATQTCGYTSDVCVAPGTGTTGAACVGDGDCAPVQGAGNAPDCLQSGWPGGICTEPCSNYFNNPNFAGCSMPGAVCAGSVAAQPGATSTCLMPCQQTSDCRSPGYVCDTVLHACSPACSSDAQCTTLWNTGALCSASTGACCGLTGMPCCTLDGGCSGMDDTGNTPSSCAVAQRTCT